jgi:hypothetical protein
MNAVRHNLFEDAQALLVAPLFFAFAVLLFREAGLLTGGTVGVAFLPNSDDLTDVMNRIARFLDRYRKRYA